MADDKRIFIYQDARGNVSARNIANVSESDDYLQGICTQANALRTFRKDRILEAFAPDTSDADIQDRLVYHKSHSPKIAASKPMQPSRDAIEICFTRFKKDDKQRLTAMAVEAGMQIRAGVTQNLDFLCGGYNAGPAKLEKSRHQGTTVLTESQFCSLIETGEVPDQ